MALFPEDTSGFNYAANGYKIFDKVSAGSITGARVNIKKDRAIAISMKHGNALSKCKGSLKECYNIANQARYLYSVTYGKSFPVSTKAMAWEIWLHAAPEALDKVINNKVVRIIIGTTIAGKIASALSAIVAGHTDYADVGINDSLRKYDGVFEEAYNLIY